MKMMLILKQLFCIKKPTYPSHQDNEEEVAKDLISRYAEGNVSLHLGAYLTEEEADEMKQDVFQHELFKASKS